MFADRAQASRAEWELKQLPRARKLAWFATAAGDLAGTEMARARLPADSLPVVADVAAMNAVASDFLRDGAGQAASLLRALGNEHRLLVLCLLIERGELSVGQILEQVSLSPSALSQHLARMRSEGLIDYRRQAQTLYYRITDPAVAEIVATLKRVYCP